MRELDNNAHSVFFTLLLSDPGRKVPEKGLE